MTQPTQPPPLRVSRTFDATRDVVFQAWGSADRVKAWFSPKTYTVPDATVDMRVGGAFDVCLQSPSGQTHWTRGRFIQVTPPDRLVIDLHATGQDGQNLFRAWTQVTFADAPSGGTVMEVEQTYTFLDPASAEPMVAGASEGWRTTLDKLGQVISGAAPAPGRGVVHGSFHQERHYPAPIEQVWRALTDVAAKQAWFVGPPGAWDLLERHMDVREGGRELVRGRFSNGVVSTFAASYHDVIPHQRLVYSYVMLLDDKRISVSLATMQLRASAGGTTLLLDEQGAFLDGYDGAAQREQGSAHLLDQLGASLADH